jgi:hypothetical protein
MITRFIIFSIYNLTGKLCNNNCIFQFLNFLDLKVMQIHKCNILLFAHIDDFTNFKCKVKIIFNLYASAYKF